MPSDRPPPVIRIDAGGSGMQVALAGDWTLQGLCPLPEDLRRELAVAPPEGTWNLAGVTRLDSFGAVLLWRHWGRRRPARLDLPEALAPVLARAEALPGGDLPAEPGYRFLDGTAQLGRAVHAALHHLLGFVALVGHILIGLGGLLRRRDYWPLREISANFYKVGVRAMPVTALVGFLIGVVMSYLENQFYPVVLEKLSQRLQRDGLRRWCATDPGLYPHQSAPRFHLTQQLRPCFRLPAPAGRSPPHRPGWTRLAGHPPVRIWVRVLPASACQPCSSNPTKLLSKR